MKNLACYVVSLVLFFGFAGIINATGNATGDIWMSNDVIHQHMIFNVFDEGQNSYKDTGQVKYWNFDYPGILDYTVEVVCVTVIGNETRFMFQVPVGWPGFSGLYIVSYVKDDGKQGLKGDLYEHSGTLSYVTAKEWCETGIGFSPTGYSLNFSELTVR